MNKYLFRRQLDDLTRRVEVEGKRNPSWLMGYLQGKGNEKLTGYQCAALIDLLLVPLEKLQNGVNPELVQHSDQKQQKEVKTENAAASGTVWRP